MEVTEKDGGKEIVVKGFAEESTRKKYVIYDFTFGFQMRGYSLAVSTALSTNTNRHST